MFFPLIVAFRFNIIPIYIKQKKLNFSLEQISQNVIPMEFKLKCDDYSEYKN